MKEVKAIMKLKNNAIDVLAIDDQQDILDLSKIFLERFDDRLDIETYTNPEEALISFREGSYDAIISDYEMPEMTGLELLEEVREIDENFPFILYTGKGTEEVAQDAIGLDITDYFQKEAGTDQYSLIANKLVDSVEGYRATQEKEIFEQIVENSENPIIVTDSSSSIIYANPAFEETTGYSKEEIKGQNPRILNSGAHSAETFEEMYQSLRNGEVFRIDDMTNIRKDGSSYIHNQQIFPISTNGEEFYAAISVMKD